MPTLSRIVGEVPERHVPHALLHDPARHALPERGQGEGHPAAGVRTVGTCNAPEAGLRRGVLPTDDAAVWGAFSAAVGRQVARADEEVRHSAQRFNLRVSGYR